MLGDFMFIHEYRNSDHFIRWIYQPAAGTKLLFNRQPVTVDFVRSSNGRIVFTVRGEKSQSEAWPWELKLPA